jgi:phage-related baseplate assembly protein
MSRLGVLELSQLPPFVVIQVPDAEAILAARMAKLVEIWTQNDPPAGAIYDTQGLEFDPIKITQEVSTYFEIMLEDRVNQAARAVTLAFAINGDLDAIASRYPGGMPREPGESDDMYRTRIWLSPNTLSQWGTYESYTFFGLTGADLAGMPLRDCMAWSNPGQPNVYVVIMADGPPVTANPDGTFTAFPSPVPSDAQVTAVYSYITERGQGRKGLTDVVSVVSPKVVQTDYSIRILVFPGWDQVAIMQQLAIALATLIENQRYIGFSHTLAAIDAVLKVSGVFNVLIDSPAADVIIAQDAAVVVNSITLTYAGRAGIGPLPVTAP